MEESDFCDGSDGGWWPSGLRGMEASVKRGINSSKGRDLCEIFYASD